MSSTAGAWRAARFRFASSDRARPRAPTYKAGEWLAVSGTTSFDSDGKIVGHGHMYSQSRQAIANIAAALERAGATLGDVVRTRVYATDLMRFAEIARAHREIFEAAPPASTVVEERPLVHPDMLVESEAAAYTRLPPRVLPQLRSSRARDAK